MKDDYLKAVREMLNWIEGFESSPQYEQTMNKFNEIKTLYNFSDKDIYIIGVVFQAIMQYSIGFKKDIDTIQDNIILIALEFIYFMLENEPSQEILQNKIKELSEKYGESEAVCAEMFVGLLTLVTNHVNTQQIIKNGGTDLI